MPKFVKENLIFILVSFLPYASTPAIVHAQQSSSGVTPFLQPLSLTRGSLAPGLYESFIIDRITYCDIMKNEWGWSSCEGVDTMVAGFNGNIDTLIVEEPTSDGFVKFDDWNSKDKDEEIKQIEKELRKSLKSQAKATNSEISFLGWQAYPTLNQTTNVMHYATRLRWNGDEIINVKATKFDRKGFVVFRIVPYESDLSATEINTLVAEAINYYQPAPQQSYASFVTGDKVAAVGALGVLATLVGVKYGRAAAAGFLAILLAFLKKGGFLILLPILWLGRVIKGMFSK